MNFEREFREFKERQDRVEAAALTMSINLNSLTLSIDNLKKAIDLKIPKPVNKIKKK